jgi:hypothetical protein
VTTGAGVAPGVGETVGDGDGVCPVGSGVTGGVVIVGAVAGPSPLPARMAPVPPTSASPAPTMATFEIPPVTNPTAGIEGKTAAGPDVAKGATGMSFRHSPALATIIGSNCWVRPTSIFRLVTST